MIDISPINEYQIRIIIDHDVSIKSNELMQNFCVLLRKEGYSCLASYTSILLRYNPIEITYVALINHIKSLYNQLNHQLISSNKIIIPTLYNGIDLEYVANYNDLTVKSVINLHSSREYYVYMLGFTPGFAYLSDIDKKISTPRLENPRLKIPKGSVGIANEQTGIYPVESPGGWRIIGQTPLELFNLKREKPFLINPGDRIEFKPITKKEFLRIKEGFNEKY